jgi:8-amino-7-oxononanoate synthase
MEEWAGKPPAVFADAGQQAEDPFRWVTAELARLAEQGLHRFRRLRGEGGPCRILLDGRRVLHFASNDYLGLAGHPQVIAAARRVAEQFGWGAGASPLVCGFTEVHQALETALADWQQSEAALLFPSGYAANVGAICALVGPGDVVYCDEANHASIWDGCRLSRADVRVYRHSDPADLRNQLAKRGRYRRALVVSDSVFSIDGDLAPLKEIAQVALEYNCMMLVDEAHALGIFGPEGRGYVAELNLSGTIAVRVGTLSKALGSAGGFVVGPRPVVDWLIHRARSYIYSTSMPPAAAAAAREALLLLRSMPEAGAVLLARARWLKESLRQRGWQIGPSQSQILSLVIGNAEQALRLTQQLLSEGIYCPAMRPPTVPEGKSSLRISLTLAHSPDMLEELLTALDRVIR